MKYIVDLPDTYTSKSALFGDILSIPICLEGGKRYGIPTGIKLEPYTEPDEDESYGASRYKSIGLAFLKWLGNDAGDKLKSADDVYRFLDKNCCNKDAVEQEVWEFASMLMNMHPDVAEDIYWSMNGGKGIGVAAEMTYQEAKAKYNEWLKQKDEIKVGDEVLHTTGDGVRGVITKVNSDDFYVMDEGGYAYWEASKSYWRKTGRHFSEVAELLKKMSEDT